MLNGSTSSVATGFHLFKAGQFSLPRLSFRDYTTCSHDRFLTSPGGSLFLTPWLSRLTPKRICPISYQSRYIEATSYFRVAN